MRRAALAVVIVAACGGKAVFRLSSDENNPLALRETLARRELPVQPTPVNASHAPRVFAATAKSIVAYDLAAGKPLWKADADVSSRIAVGGDFIAEAEGKQLVARDQGTGAARWKTAIPGTFVGVAADRDRAYLAYREADRYWLAGYDRSGGQLWKADADGTLGAPGAHGGVVYAPFLNQWLSIIDGRTGRMLTRVRGIDEQISVLRVTSRVAYYGSKKGVFRLDERSASGKRDDAAYTQLKIPPQLDRASYGRDAYDAVQSGYSAADRARVLFASEPSGPMQLSGDGYAIHYFRYVFGFASTGEPRWAYNHPRVELVASDHTGLAIVALASDGEIVALDPQTGAVRARQKLATQQPVLGATFDADGWLPTGNEPVDMTQTLVAIARDHDARFDRVKELAVQLLAKETGADVTKELLGVLADNRAPQKLKDTVAELLVARKDPASLPALVAQLAVHTDFIAKTEPEALGPVAKAIGGLGGGAIDSKGQAAALAALQSHLDAASTPIPDLVAVIDAMAAIGGGAERAALASHLLLYHADDEVGGSAAWARAIVLALAKAGPGERELLRYVATDPRTKPGLASAIHDALHD